MLMIQLFGVADVKCFFHVCRPLFSFLQRLLGRIPHARHMVRINRDSRYVTYSPRDVLGLVITPFSQPSRVKGHRHNYLDFIEEIRVHKLYRRQPSEMISDVGTLHIFHPMDHHLYRMIFLVKEESRRFLDMLHSRQSEGLFRDIIPHMCLFRSRQVTGTLRTEDSLLYIPRARNARARVYNMEKIRE